MTVTEYINSLTPEHLSTLFVKPETPENKWDAMTMVRLPKFKYEYKALLNDTLADMGMTELFDENKSDLTRMTSVGKPYVSRVIHDTFIQLDEEGTKAAAVTIIATADNAVMMPEKELNFDRPFVYAIVDTETDMPVFMGTLTNIPK